MSLLGLLGTVGAVVGWTLLGVLLLTIAALAVPFDALFDSTRSSHPFRVTWLWGAVRLYPRREKGHQGADKGRRRKKKKKESSRPAKPPNPARRRGLLELARDPEFRAHLLRDLLRLIRRIEIPLIDLRLALGLADPADTGLLYGILTAAMGAAAADPQIGIGSDERHRVSVEPSFDDDLVEVTGRANLRIVPIAVVGTAVVVVVGPRGRRILRTLWRTRR